MPQAIPLPKLIFVPPLMRSSSCIETSRISLAPEGSVNLHLIFVSMSALPPLKWDNVIPHSVYDGPELRAVDWTTSPALSYTPYASSRISTAARHPAKMRHDGCGGC